MTHTLLDVTLVFDLVGCSDSTETFRGASKYVEMDSHWIRNAKGKH